MGTRGGKLGRAFPNDLYRTPREVFRRPELSPATGVY
jgi:hypothetical protein